MNRTLISPLLEAWARRAIPRLARSTNVRPSSPHRRALLVHVDGVSRRTLLEATAAGRMPFLASMLSSRAYDLDAAFWGTPPSTPVFEASALYGVRQPNIPAYRWYDRARGRVVQMNSPVDASEVEARLRRSGTSMLGNDGTAYLTLFQGAEANLVTMAALTDLRAAARDLRTSFGTLLASARRSTLRNVGRFAWEIAHALVDGARAGLPSLDWRHEQELALVRVFVLGALSSLVRARAMADMVRGTSVVYLVEPGFDEVSHRRGPASPQAARELSRIDASLAHLHAIAHSVEHRYDVYVFSDHGQASSTPYEHVAGRTFAESLGLPFGDSRPLSKEVQRALLDGRSCAPPAESPLAPVVVEVGGMAHVYLGATGRPLEAFELLVSHSRLLARVLADPYVGFVAVRRGTEAIGLTANSSFTADEVTQSSLPAGPSVRAVAELLRALPQMSNAGDLVVVGATTAEGVVGFSWEAGTHGGVSSAETDSFVLWPTGAVSLDSLGHAADLHRRLTERYTR